MDNWKNKFINVTWEDLVNLAFSLSRKVKKSPTKFDLIIAIARGGLTIAQLLSDQLGLPITSFTVESYKNLKQKKLPHITYGLSAKLKHKKILLVDDVCDTGKTFLRGLTYLEELGANRKNITTLSLHYKPHALYKPDFFAVKTSAWVIYPYEVRETIEILAEIWAKENISQREIQNRLRLFSFQQNQIRKYINQHDTR